MPRISSPASLTVDPHDWIRPPYSDCGKCGAVASVGLLIVSGSFVRRRCRACMRDSRERLPPPPQPHVLYLDQWALSSLAKARLPDTRARFASEQDSAAGAGMWPRLFSRIERLVKAGLLVCPASSVHRAESSLDIRRWEALRRLHVYLGGDARFANHKQVKRDQLYAAFCAWLDGDEPVFPNREAILRLRRGWPGLLQVSSSYQPELAEVEALRSGRKRRSGGLQQQVEAWASEPRTFDERRTEQLAAYGPSYRPEINPMREFWVLSRHAMDERSMPTDRWASEVERFLSSDAPGETPFAQIASAAIASIGWLAEHAQRPKIDAGTLDDVQAFATYAPFCDAFTVDRRFAHVLRSPPMADYVPAGLRLFAANELKSLESWLIDLERAAPVGHLESIRAIYGDRWLQPFATVLEAAGPAAESDGP